VSLTRICRANFAYFKNRGKLFEPKPFENDETFRNTICDF